MEDENRECVCEIVLCFAILLVGIDCMLKVHRVARGRFWTKLFGVDLSLT